MSLIWAENFAAAGGSSLAALLRGKKQTTDALVQAPAADPAVLGAAFMAQQAAEAASTAALQQAEALLTAATAPRRTHVLIIGVARYNDSAIPEVATAVHGARDFAQWLLTEFQHPDTLLGSVEMLLSPTGAQGDWAPPGVVAAKLGLQAGNTLPVEAATFANIEAAFARWLARAGANSDGTALLYFAGHGLWKVKPYLVPQDGQPPSNGIPPQRLIDIRGTLGNLLNSPPATQLFFVDACQELTFPLLTGFSSEPGQALRQPTDAAAVKRDAWLFQGSRAQGLAYGPLNAAPFFTQDLLQCLRSRGGGVNIGGSWRVQTSSLKIALEQSAALRSSQQPQPVEYSSKTEDSEFTAEICALTQAPEVFVKVSCSPLGTLAKARLSVLVNNAALAARPVPAAGEWYTTLARGDYLAHAEFPPATHQSEDVKFVAWPPFAPVVLSVI